MSALSNLGYMRKQWKQPCHFNGDGNLELSIIVNTAISAAIPTLISLNQFSCLDIIKLRAGISWKCGRILKGILKQAHGPAVVDAGVFWYNITGAALTEQALWYWFLADLATEYTANWSSLMYSELGCNVPYSGTLYSTIGVLDLPGNVKDHDIDPLDGGSNPCASLGPSGIFVNAGCEVSIAYNCTYDACNPVQEQAAMQMALVNVSTGETVDASNVYQPGAGTGNGNIIAVERISGGNVGTAYKIQATGDGDPTHCTQITGGTVLVTTYGEAINFHPVSCVPRRTS